MCRGSQPLLVHFVKEKKHCSDRSCCAKILFYFFFLVLLHPGKATHHFHMFEHVHPHHIVIIIVVYVNSLSAVSKGYTDIHFLSICFYFFFFLYIGRANVDYIYTPCWLSLIVADGLYCIYGSRLLASSSWKSRAEQQTLWFSDHLESAVWF